MSVGIILVHGYTGSPRDLRPLAGALADDYGPDAVTSVCLPGHRMRATPVFDPKAFLGTIGGAVDSHAQKGRTIVILGHSTGAILALSYLSSHSVDPLLLIMAAAPKYIDGAYLARWKRHSGDKEVPLTSVARMVSFINSVGSGTCHNAYPVVLLHGDNDELVPSEDLRSWTEEGFTGSIRTVMVPSGDHDLFHGPGGPLAVDVARRFIADAVADRREGSTMDLTSFCHAEPGARGFLDNSPFSKRHLAGCPSGQKLSGISPSLGPMAATEPVMANIEVTTYCTLKCAYCARTLRTIESRHMSKHMFSHVLDLLPHAYRITLVGLGEPLLHPDICDLVALASSRGRRVTLVTNAMFLDGPLGAGLIRAGVSSMVFSVDAAQKAVAEAVRAGTDLDRVTGNIRMFMDKAKSSGSISTAIFSAVSLHTAPHLGDVVDLAAGLGVDALMLTDLNFSENAPLSLWKNKNDGLLDAVHKAVEQGFSRSLPVLTVWGLEEFGLATRYKDSLLLSPAHLFRRSTSRTHCYSPWQTIPVGVDGNLTICDCQPGRTIGNLFTDPFLAMWNSTTMIEYRRRMLSPTPPKPCLSCPRF